MHDDDARAAARTAVADSLWAPCEVGWLAGIVGAVFNDKVNLVPAGVERNKGSHGRTFRTDSIASSDGRPTSLLLCVHGYCDSRMGTPMVMSSAAHWPGAPWEHNFVNPGTESQRRHLVNIIKDWSPKGAYDGHAVLATGMF